MLARPHQAPPVVLPGLDAVDVPARPVVVDPKRLLGNRHTRFAAQFLADTVLVTTLEAGGRAGYWVVAPSAEFWARLDQDATGGWTVRQGGPRRIWDEIEDVAGDAIDWHKPLRLTVDATGRHTLVLPGGRELHRTF